MYHLCTQRLLFRMTLLAIVRPNLRDTRGIYQGLGRPSQDQALANLRAIHPTK